MKRNKQTNQSSSVSVMTDQEKTEFAAIMMLPRTKRVQALKNFQGLKQTKR